MALARALAEPTALEPTVFAEPIRRNWWGPLDGSPPRDFRPEGRPGADALRSDGRHSDARGSDGAEASETARLRARLSFVRAEIAKREAQIETREIGASGSLKLEGRCFDRLKG